jgi:hypothetical protein
MKKLLLLGLALGLLVVAGVAGVRVWRSHIVARAEARAYATAQRLLTEGQPLQALAIAEHEPRTDARFAWSALELEALTAARQIARLVGLYERSPERILAHEEASLLVARACLAARQPERVAKVRESWRGREGRPELWLALDSDQLAHDGDTGQAERLLRAATFNGEAEATRLVRLSLYAAIWYVLVVWKLF